MDNQEYKVRVEHLTKYFGNLHVLDDVSFNIKKGEFLCVVGPTGCGKTTFLNLLTRIYMPTKGQLYIDNEPADPKKHNLAVVFQEPSSMPWLTVEKNLRFGMEIKKLPKEEIDRRVENMIELLGLQEFRDKYPHQLSVSTAQRIIIGRACLCIRAVRVYPHKLRSALMTRYGLRVMAPVVEVGVLALAEIAHWEVDH